jgi:hypothetical protein
MKNVEENKSQTQLAQQIEVANLISQSLLFSLERQYLDIPLEKAPFIQPVSKREPASEVPYLLRLEQVGNPMGPLPAQPFTALQTALMASHNPGDHSLIFTVTGDGRTNNVYFGVRGHGPHAYSSAFVDSLGDFLQGNWPGTRLVRTTIHDPQFKETITLPLERELHYGVALTGIPSLKGGDQFGYPQSLDRLLRGLRGLPFMYLVVAEPMGPDRVNQIIYLCRELIGRIHTLTKSTVSRTLTESSTTTYTTGEQSSEMRGSSTSTSTGKTRGFGAGSGLSALVASLAVLFPPAGFLSSLAAVAGITLAPNFNFSNQTSQTQTDSFTQSYGVNRSVSEAFGASVAESIGREYINAHAQAAERQLRQFLDRFERSQASGCWQVGVYFLAKEPHVALQGGHQLRSLLSGQHSSFEPIRIHNLQSLWRRQGVHAALKNLEQPALALVGGNPLDPAHRQLIHHPLGPAFDGLTTPLNTEELALLVNFPRREVPGIRLAVTADFSLNVPRPEGKSIALGHLLEGGQTTSLSYPVAYSTLAKHTLVAGITGSGKTTTCRRLLAELHKNGIPFLVVEPAKDEYVEWAFELNKAGDGKPITVYMPGVETWRGQLLEQRLVLNPFEVIWPEGEERPAVLSHLDRLKSILVAAFPMQEVLPVLLEELLLHAYCNPVNWFDPKPPPRDIRPPTLSQLINQISPIVRGKGYDGSVTTNLTAALTSRIQSLRQGWKGQLFDQPASTPWSRLFDQPTVINLSQLGDDRDKALAMAIVLLFLYEYRRSQYSLAGGRVKSLEHLTVIEEAHRILNRTAPGLPEQANPQAHTAEMFANMLAEIRAYGQGLLIVDQVPARLLPDAIKNTNLKIVHRLVANDDREALAGSMALTPEQAMVINRLQPGQAIVYGDRDDTAAWIRVTTK